MTQRESNPFEYSDDNKRYLTYSYYLRRRFGRKVFKVPLNIDLGCPNRDGSKGTGGCIFCSAKLSGDFAGDPCAKTAPRQMPSPYPIPLYPPSNWKAAPNAIPSGAASGKISPRGRLCLLA